MALCLLTPCPQLLSMPALCRALMARLSILWLPRWPPASMLSPSSGAPARLADKSSLFCLLSVLQLDETAAGVLTAPHVSVTRSST